MRYISRNKTKRSVVFSEAQLFSFSVNVLFFYLNDERLVKSLSTKVKIILCYFILLMTVLSDISRNEKSCAAFNLVPRDINFGSVTLC